MKTVILLMLSICFSYVSCENRSEDVFSLDRCVGEYICDVTGMTTILDTGGRPDLPKPPSSNFPRRGTVFTVTQTGDNELTLKAGDFVWVAKVEILEQYGTLTIPDTIIHLENEHFTMSLPAKYELAFITPNILFIKQVAKGTTVCRVNDEVFTLKVANDQYFEGEKR